MSHSLWSHGLKHSRLPCPWLSPGVCSNSCPLMPSNHLILCCRLLLPPSIFPSIRVLSSESALHIRWPNYWSFNFSISPSNEYSGLISFRIDWFDYLAVQGSLKRVFFSTIIQKHQFFNTHIQLKQRGLCHLLSFLDYHINLIGFIHPSPVSLQTLL